MTESKCAASVYPRAKQTRYIFPPRATQVIPRHDTEIYAQLNWQAQFKVNDSHCLIKYLPSPTGLVEDIQVELWNRHGSRLRDYHATDELLDELRQVHQMLNLSLSEWSLLDGGLLDRKHRAIKDTIAIWDILVRNGEQLIGSTYEERLNWLYRGQTERPRFIGACPVGFDYTTNIFGCVSFTSEHWPWMWECIGITNEPYTDKRTGDVSPLIEGVVLKCHSAPLEYGFREQNNGDWLVRSRVTTGRHRF